MRKITLVLAVSAIFSLNAAFAGDMGHNKSCETIAKACLAGDYTRGDGPNDKFYHGCMKPLLLGKTVTNVSVDAATVKDCRTNKIEQMKSDITELEAVK